MVGEVSPAVDAGVGAVTAGQVRLGELGELGKQTRGLRRAVTGSYGSSHGELREQSRGVRGAVTGS